MSIAQAGSNFALTCSAVELVDHSGETVVTWKDQDGRPITTGGDFVITRRNEPSRVDYNLQFMPLRVQHTGRYTCEVSIPSVGYNESTSTSIQVVPGMLLYYTKTDTYIECVFPPHIMEYFLSLFALLLQCHMALLNCPLLDLTYKPVYYR